MKTVVTTDLKVLENLKKVFGTPVDTRKPNIFKYTFEVSFESGVTKTYVMCAETLDEARKDLDEDIMHSFDSYLGRHTSRVLSVA